MVFICFNGHIIAQRQLAINTSDEAWRWGHGFFESGRWSNNRWLLADLHYRRIQHTAAALHLSPLPALEALREKVAETVTANNLQAGARIRIQFWPSEKGELDYCIEATALPQNFEWLPAGFKIAVYHSFIKCADAFSELKLCSYAPYLQARKWANANGFDEAVILNATGHICEGAHTNIFIFQKNTWLTPPLSEAPVAGVCRQYTLTAAASCGISVREEVITVQQLKDASEVILTNAVQGVQWVAQLGKKKYACIEAKKLHTVLFEPLTP